MDAFNIEAGFCPACGTILPPLKSKGYVNCYNCKSEFDPDIFDDQEEEFTIYFNTYDPENKQPKINTEDSDEPEGPVVDRKCRQCGHDKMSYATVQLRSADEGQTVFFTCLKCKFKDSENS